ncbi:hypothetical protein [Chitinophaga nivalis]|uniref:Colicin import membrane protein n=1 Tax=Chitinophaga nivalis TaxID=2991709 RepID=A0ABT3IVQ2_9BACT|nr:hypothetical protein [Chitinophaga nivalis]MCW3462249.1 hypothetical protein [Chitinophaga nivalis]MCW3488059.1 hypothetical protein [Chitinophaga nivalis]
MINYLFMKKLLTGMLALFMGLTAAVAQTPATVVKKEGKAVHARAEEKTVKTKQDVKQTAAPAVVATDAKLKKDGTPDKRFKENKSVVPAAGPTKKDGTPDMRYKANNKKTVKKG